ncbi:hypothetical protein Salat_1544700 [Sesamum alatum]|uniref:Uncharacterized protein n=1 Tax=Sesamum alatum TaxID=300844 RepID=A0AAE2CML5_9LAMI|nr:hypothetical protein Salat_1544700 [Sesamum alatum]
MKVPTEILGPTLFDSALCFTLLNLSLVISCNNGYSFNKEFFVGYNMQGRNVDPLILVKHLETANLVLQEYSEQVEINMASDAKGQFWFWASRIIVANDEIRLNTTNVFQVAGIEAQSLRQQFGQAVVGRCFEQPASSSLDPVAGNPRRRHHPLHPATLPTISFLPTNHVCPRDVGKPPILLSLSHLLPVQLRPPLPETQLLIGIASSSFSFPPNQFPISASPAHVTLSLTALISHVRTPSTFPPEPTTTRTSAPTYSSPSTQQKIVCQYCSKPASHPLPT